ncbi:hypothetical protein [Streptomyces sp. NPDC056169]|uniref:hypothetical protein n=1 Tax=Streptomyces sp. NPDC056169 TaxID=3345734 RepID=UPI0035E0867B
MTDLGTEIQRLKARITAVERASRLGAAAIDDTALEVRDDAGSLRALVGQQGDGTTAVNVVNGPTPAAPTTPLVASVVGGVAAEWDGQLVGGTSVPLDFARIEVHAAAGAGFTPTSATLVGTVETPQGGIVVIPTATPVYVRLLTRTTSGTASAPSTQNGPIAPAMIVADDVADGIITGTKLAADAIDGKTITGATLRTAATGQRIVIAPSGTPGTNAVQMYSGVATETEPGELLASVNSDAGHPRPQLILWSPTAGAAGSSAAMRLIGGGGTENDQGEFYLTTGWGSGSETKMHAFSADGDTQLGQWSVWIQQPDLPNGYGELMLTGDTFEWVDGREKRFGFSSHPDFPVGLSTNGSLFVDDTIQVGGVDQGRGRKSFTGLQTSTSTTTTTEIAAITTPSLTFTAGRAYRITYHGLLLSSVANDIVRCRVWRGSIGGSGVSLVDSINSYQIPVANQHVLMDMSQVVTNTTASNITAVLIGTVLRTTGTGNVQLVANASNPAWIDVQDIGLATDYPSARAV